ncbi:MAG TPA: 16S rRNA (cytosine(1402)-N(4))-methyltransferase RsmH [Candidatus Limnocylindrales bacterium]|jgi:16S rRNA (cytosine1402-N4)-methyltransferase
MAGQDQGHRPVMVEEVMMALSPLPGQLHVDATLGGGGHAVRILEATTPDGRLLGLDADQAAIARCAIRLAPFGERVVLRQANFEQLAEVAADLGHDAVDGILFDLGLSSFQLADDERGFSFRSSGPLDLRFDARHGRPASDLLATSDERELTRILRDYGEEPHARRIAKAIVDERQRSPIDTAAQLAALVERVVPAPRGRRRTHPATRTFQALRIAVNRELEVLPRALAAALELLRPGGRLVVLAYHSLEDRIVKRFVAAERRGCICPPAVPVCVCGRAPRLRPIGPTPGFPADSEITANPRARSARLRAAERLAA